ncbi:hypothetical protein GCM10009780_66280 [Actinomadura alba]
MITHLFTTRHTPNTPAANNCMITDGMTHAASAPDTSVSKGLAKPRRPPGTASVTLRACV